MSIQPLQFSNREANIDGWHEYLELAELLSIEYSLKSIISYATNVFRQIYASTSKIWLVPSFSDLLKKESIQNHEALISELTPIMDIARRETKIVGSNQGQLGVMDTPAILASPLFVKGQLIGVIQLEKTDQSAFRPQESKFISGFCSQFSIALDYLLRDNHTEYLNHCIAHLSAVEEICRSVLSNLDRDSLINSVLSLLHQMLGFSKVNLYIVKEFDKGEFQKIGISQEGINDKQSFYLSSDNGGLAWSVLELKPIIENNISNDENASPSETDQSIRSEMVIPLSSGGTLVGVLELCSNSVDIFGPQTMIGNHLLAQNIAVAIRNAALFHSEQMRRVVFSRLHDNLGTLSADVSLNDILQRLLSEMEELIPSDAAAIWLLDNMDAETGVDQQLLPLRLAAARKTGQYLSSKDESEAVARDELFEKFLQSSLVDGELLARYPWLSELISSNLPVIRDLSSPYEPLGGIFEFTQEYSAIGIPMRLNDHAMGMIVLAHHLPGQYDAETQSVTGAFASYAAIVIENTRLYAAAHDQAWISTVLLQVAEATQSISNMDELLDTVARMLPGLIGVEACTIFLWDQSIEAFFPKASYGFDDEQLSRLNGWEIFPGSVLAFDQLQKNNIPVILNSEVLTEEVSKQIFPSYDFSKDLVLLFPLISQNNLCGAILIDFTNSSLEINSSQEVWDENYTLIEGAARQTAIAIENLQLIKSQEEEAYISVALLQVAQAIVSLNQLDEILGSIVRITPILVGVKRCIIYLWDNQEMTFRQSQNFGFSKNDLSMIGQYIKPNTFPFFDALHRNNQIIYHPLNKQSSPLTWNEITAEEINIVEVSSSENEEEISIKLDTKTIANRDHLLIGFPLSVKGEVLGVMLVEEEDPVRGSPSLHIREKRVEIVKGITQQAAIAIQNELLQQEAVKSERMERELQLAREIQKTFLPDKIPELQGWDICVRWQPAREVGGDFYDILTLDDDRIGFVMADVADKGMPAALFMTLIRTLIRAAAKEKLSPAAVLKQVNELLVPDSKHGMFVTIFYGVFSLSSGKLIYANAGHNPPIVKKINREELIELSRTSMALGLFDEVEVDEREMQLHPGDWMLLYTDGVTEAFSASEEMFGIERLFSLLSHYDFVSSSALLEVIEGSLSEFIKGADLSDDLTLAAIHRKLP